jgi:precorrin-4/cobalt-precorrin-4 C11-methyltransferase
LLSYTGLEINFAWVLGYHPTKSLDMNKIILKPQVYLIGVGPGDPELLTLKAYQVIAQADIILYANTLIPPAILAPAHPEAELIPTGEQTLETILPTMINGVKAGKVVARLHSGDLSLYSAIHEQMLGLTAAGIPFELIPGIGVFQAAAAKLATELTIPELVQTIILTRLSGQASPVPEREELSSLAAHRASLCLYLSARHVQIAQDKLLAHYPPDTPVAICFRLGWPEEKIWLVSLSQMSATTYQENLTRTTLYLISPALQSPATTRSHLYQRYL